LWIVMFNILILHFGYSVLKFDQIEAVLAEVVYTLMYH